MHQTKSQPPAVDLDELVGLFFKSNDQLANFKLVAQPDSMPEPFKGLLKHEAHMTVTVEAFHGCPVDVQVHATKYGQREVTEAEKASRWYAREITLHRQSDGSPVQYGIVRLNIDLLAPEVWEEIRSEQIPLGRVLIEHGVLREVELCELWEVVAHQHLANLLGVPSGSTVYGRTARIFCDYLPAIELLEIVVG